MSPAGVEARTNDCAIAGRAFEYNEPMQPPEIRVRFVGGPWHNLFGPLGVPTIYGPKGDIYRLAEFHTQHWRTKYYQYLHSSLIFEDRVAPSTYCERLPNWKINSRQLYFRLRRAVKSATQ